MFKKKQKEEIENSSLDWHGNSTNSHRKQIRKKHNKKKKEALKYEE